MRPITLFLGALWLAIACTASAQTAPGKMTGGIAYSLPEWFKPSLLHFKDDVEEARKQGKHVLVFLHLEECPYCARMLKESFASAEDREFLRTHFDVIGINVRGASEVVWIDGNTYTERSLASHLKSFGTPTLVFLGQDGKPVLQLPGYRDPRALRHAFDYVRTRSYRGGRSFAAWLEARERPVLYQLRDHPLFARAAAPNLKGYRGPIAILFEDRYCADCERFHERTLRHPEVIAEMKKFFFVRFDARSHYRVVDPGGKATSPAQWVRALGLTYRPALVLYDEGREIMRIDGQLYRFHLKERLRYVSGKHYKRFESLSQYNAARRAELLEQGIDIDYGEMKTGSGR
jgi:thioredoxin-related protein